jgi:DNA polymerase-3 subunit delta'
MPLPRPKAGEPDRQIDELEASLADALEERRSNPLYLPPDGMAGHFVATARLLQRWAAMTPAVGRTKVFLLAEADRLVPQEANPEAANALLKLLEEPAPDSQFLLTVEDPNRLLPTIRSRVVPLRLGRLTDELVGRFLAEHAGLRGEDLGARVALARGSIGRALAWSGREDKAASAADELLEAFARGPAGRAERALKQGTWSARGEFTAMLDALAESLAAAARSASGEPSGRPLPGTLRRPRPLEALLEAQARVAAAREAAQGNVNPQLLLAALSDELAEVL